MFPKLYRNLGFSFGYTVLAALAVSSFFVLQGYASHVVHQYNFPFSWFAVSVKTFITYLIWSLFSPLLKGFAEKLREPGIRKVVGWVIISMCGALIHQVLVIVLFSGAYYVYHGIWQELIHLRNAVELTAGFFSSLIQLWIITGLFFGVSYYRSYLEKQKELTNAQLDALKMQLHPHFLFNTLHAISSLMDEDVKGAQKMITQLGDLLRSILERDQKHTIPLSEEIAYIQNYLDIERIRFQDRLRIIYDIDKEVLDMQVPTLILQPLVENAIKHGISKKKDGGNIEIKALVSQGTYLQMIVEDNGVGSVLNGKRKRRGVGLRNIRERLFQLYEDDFVFETHSLNGDNSGYRATMSIPIKQ